MRLLIPLILLSTLGYSQNNTPSTYYGSSIISTGGTPTYPTLTPIWDKTGEQPGIKIYSPTTTRWNSTDNTEFVVSDFMLPGESSANASDIFERALTAVPEGSVIRIDGNAWTFTRPLRIYGQTHLVGLSGNSGSNSRVQLIFPKDSAGIIIYKRDCAGCINSMEAQRGFENGVNGGTGWVGNSGNVLTGTVGDGTTHHGVKSYKSTPGSGNNVYRREAVTTGVKYYVSVFFRKTATSDAGTVYAKWLNSSNVQVGTLYQINVSGNSKWPNKPKYLFDNTAPIGTTNTGLTPPAGATQLEIGTTCTVGQVWTDDWCLQTTFIGSVPGCSIENMNISTASAYTPTTFRYQSNRDGIYSEGAIYLARLTISGFNGDGIELNSQDLATNVSNVNGSIITDVRCDQNSMFGLRTEGSNAQVCTFSNLDMVNNGNGGVYESSASGNLYLMPHTSSNGAQWGLVTSNCKRYAPIRDSIPAGLEAPGTIGGTVWPNYWAVFGECADGCCDDGVGGGTNKSNDLGNYPLWSNTKTYYLTGAYVVSDNGKSVFVSPYSESNSPLYVFTDGDKDNDGNYDGSGGLVLGPVGENPSSSDGGSEGQWINSTASMMKQRKNGVSFDREVGFENGDISATSAPYQISATFGEAANLNGYATDILAHFLTTGDKAGSAYQGLRLMDRPEGYEWTYGNGKEVRMRIMNQRNTLVYGEQAAAQKDGQIVFPFGLEIMHNDNEAMVLQVKAYKVVSTDATSATAFPAGNVTLLDNATYSNGDMIFNTSGSAKAPQYWRVFYNGMHTCYMKSSETFDGTTTTNKTLCSSSL